MITWARSVYCVYYWTVYCMCKYLLLYYFVLIVESHWRTMIHMMSLLLYSVILLIPGNRRITPYHNKHPGIYIILAFTIKKDNELRRSTYSTLLLGSKLLQTELVFSLSLLHAMLWLGFVSVFFFKLAGLGSALNICNMIKGSTIMATVSASQSFSILGHSKFYNRPLPWLDSCTGKQKWIH